MNPCAFVPATMIAPNVIVASAAVTLKFAVAVVPPCTTFFRNESGAGVQHVVIDQRDDVEQRNQADRVRAEDEDEEASACSGVQVLTHLRPTFGCTISSRT